MNTSKASLKSSNDVKQHFCETCRKGFELKFYLTVHNKIHSRVNRLSCNICGKRFAWKSGLKTYRLTYSDLKIYMLYL